MQIKYLSTILPFALFINASLFAANDFHFPGASKIEVIDFSAKDKQQYSRISLEGFINDGNPGEPELPVAYINLIIPSDQTAVNVNVVSSTVNEYKLAKTVFPAQHDIPTTDREITCRSSKPSGANCPEGLEDLHK